MEVKAVARYVRISPLKVRRVAEQIRGRPVDEAQALLRFMPHRAARVLEKVLKSAVANAQNNLDLARNDLIVTRAYVDAGPSMRRLAPRARGRVDVVTRRSSHVTVVVGEKS
ncbi:MAG: 50S ribosomal protein L22 [Armatimonadota bacterium]|nr:50S ribosomal protein L22 [Armatimonadota bacterium]MDR7470405.1 50S ribosomal protein L22 [Armatimonadota bacterium]MDR7473487.1 50S ribosomal protein L22 [Armatimonadota bacterium]MDR7540156.1 50S ribosomal protein L22 [Armatimonadota bacterium]